LKTLTFWCAHMTTQRLSSLQIYVIDSSDRRRLEGTLIDGAIDDLTD
jgi:hypothetical protein